MRVLDSSGPAIAADTAHTDHAKARAEHRAWLQDLQRWRREYQSALLEFARRMAPELELENFEEALDRHEAAIYAHEDLVDRHERALGLERRGIAATPDEFTAVHHQLDSRHERSRREHEQLARTQRAVLKALAMMGKRFQ